MAFAVGNERVTGTLRYADAGVNAETALPGSAAQDVESAQIKRTKHKPPPLTHFVSLPVYSKQLNNTYTEHFQYKHDNIDRSMYADVRSMHMTLLVLSLPTQSDIDKAVAAFNACAAQLQQIATAHAQSLNLQFRGVATFQPNPAKCRVIYTAPLQGDAVSVLNQLLHCVATAMLQHDVISLKTFRSLYVRPASRIDAADYSADMVDVKYHLTLINSQYARQKRRYGYMIYDGCEILQQHADTEFGTVPMQEIQLCKMQRDRVTMQYQIVTRVHISV